MGKENEVNKEEVEEVEDKPTRTARFFGFFKPLICDNGGGMSVGRLGLWLTMAPALRIWWTGGDIQTHHLYVLGIFTIYNMYKKIPMFIDLIKAWKGTK